MRVRNMAVVGAAMVAAWAGGAGIAQATPVEDGEPSCTELALAGVVEGGTTDADPCGWIPDECEYIPLLAAEGGEGTGEAVHPDSPCTDDITIDVTGDCKNPESFTFVVDATGLRPDYPYTAALATVDLSTVTDQAELAGVPFIAFPFESDANGEVKALSFTATESAETFDFPAGAFTLYWAAGVSVGEGPTSYGSIAVKECPPATTQPVVVVPPAAQPAAPVATPVAVTPVAAHPAVLANTGAPVEAAALLGGGLLLAGAGAMVATRRRAS